MKGNFPFKFWCHKVLPLVYDDSLSYYEFLCKIAKLVNDISKHNEEQDIAIANNAEHIDNVETKVDTLSDDVLGIAKRICTEAFTAGKSYFVGDYCVYYTNATDENEMLMKGELYKSNAVQLTVSEFDGSKWDKVSVASELKLLFDILDDLLKSLAKRYYPNTQYNKNDIVFYNNKLWICKEATSASEFDRSKWDEFELNTVVEMIDNVKHNIANEYEGYNGETITYPKYSVVWYNDKLYRADEEIVVDSASVLPPSENLKWEQTKVSSLFILNNWTTESIANDLASTKLEIASGYIGYSGTPLFYEKDSIVWYNDRLYKALVDVTVDSESVLPPDSNNDWQRTTIAENLGYLTRDYQGLRADVTNLDSRVENVESEAESALEKCAGLATDYQHLNNTVTSINQSLDGLNTKVFYGFNSIASNYQSYSGTPLFYPKDSYVWYLDILYKANADVTVDSASVLPPDQNSSWDSVQLTDEIGSSGSGSFDITLLAENYDETNTYDYGECVSKDGKLYVCTATTATGTWDSSKWEETNAEGAFANKRRTMRELTELIAGLSGGVQIDGVTKNVPKYTLGYFAERERSNLYGRRLFYANKATVTGSGFIQQDWTQLLNIGLYGWVQLMLGEVNRYSEVISSEIVSGN